MDPKTKSVCVVGSGVAGLTTALLLARRGQRVTLIESESRLGGHALTVKPNEDTPPVDLGFQVYNLTTYPLLTKMFDELGVETEPSEMSFSCSSDKSEWGSHGLSSLLATRGNAISPSFWMMVREMFRFGSEAKAHLATLDDNMSLGEYLARNKYDESFAQDYLLPMTAAVWSVPYNKMMAFPAKALIRFWNNHHLLDPIGDRPRWRVVAKRSGNYVNAVEAALRKLGSTIMTNCKVLACKDRDETGLTLVLEDGSEQRFDRVVFCTHTDTTLSILGNAATHEERAALELVKYEPNRVILHSDEALMPRSKEAWASWNVIQRSNQSNDAGVCVTYWLNRLQNLPEGTKTLLCTLNPIIPIDSEKIILDLTLSHPVFNAPALHAQRQVNEWQSNVELGKSRVVWFGGAWLGNGFHEDGVRSALGVAQGMCPVVDGMDTADWSLQSRGPYPDFGTRSARLGMAIFEYIARKSVKTGHLRLILPTGDELGPFGRRTRGEAETLGEPVCELRVLDLSMFWRIVRDTDIGLGEAYMERLFELPKGHSDLEGLFRLLLDNRDLFAETLGLNNSLIASPLGLLASCMYRLGNTIQSIRHGWRRNTIEGSRQNIHEHYDLGNDFYKLFLDETMTYSSGIHASPQVSLKDAQLAKYDRIIAKAQLTKDSKVLEIGCGWGGFAHRAIETTGCRVVGVTISTEQLAYAAQRAKDHKFDDKADFIFCDYRNIPTMFEPGSFDAVVSIEMLEAVGHENLPHYFDVVNKMLKSGAPAVIQVIGMPDERYDEYMHSSDFIRRHIFPGGHLPCMSALLSAIEATDLQIGDVFDIGPDYAESLLEWRKRFYAQKPKLLKMGFSEMFIRKWLFYFAYCEFGFRKKYIHDWQIVFAKNSDKAGAKASKKTSSPNREISTMYANYSPTSSWDFITGTFFGAWFVLCSFAVMEKGRHLLVIPAFMAAATLFHIGLGAMQMPAKYELGALISCLASSLTCVAAALNPNWTEIAVLIGTGLFGADLTALVVSGTYSPRLIRVVFAAIELSFLGVASFYGPEAEPVLHQLLFFHLLSSSVFHCALHANVLRETNKIVKVLLPVTLAGCFFVHASYLYNAGDSLLVQAFAGSALTYDTVAALGVTAALTKKVA